MTTQIALDTTSDMERICLKDQEYLRQRLRAWGWDEHEIEEIKKYSDDWVDFARAVVSEIQYRRQHDQYDSEENE